MPPHGVKYMRETGRVQRIIISPINDILLSVDMLLDPENRSSCVPTAPKVPPAPVIPDITPSDLQILHTPQHNQSKV